MSFTRFNYDEARTKKSLQQATGPGRYILNKPGCGDKPVLFSDPQIRMQEWGANLRTDTINLESDLMGLSRTLTKDCDSNNYKNAEAKSEKINYPICNPFTEQSRVTNPAWWYRDLEQVDWYTLPLNPQENTCIPFQNNLNTRILEKDYFIAQAPCLSKGGSDVLSAEAFSGFGNKDVNNCSNTRTCGDVKK